MMKNKIYIDNQYKPNITCSIKTRLQLWKYKLWKKKKFALTSLPTGPKVWYQHYPKCLYSKESVQTLINIGSLTISLDSTINQREFLTNDDWRNSNDILLCFFHIILLGYMFLSWSPIILAKRMYKMIDF